MHKSYNSHNKEVVIEDNKMIQNDSLIKQIEVILKEGVQGYICQAWSCFKEAVLCVLFIVGTYMTAAAIYNGQYADPSGEIKTGFAVVMGIFAAIKGLWSYFKTTDEDHRHVFLAISSVLSVYGTVGCIDLTLLMNQYVSDNWVLMVMKYALMVIAGSGAITILTVGILTLPGTVIYDIRDWINSWLNICIPRKILF